MRIGIRLAITSLVLASIIVSAIGVHLLWWRTAEGNSQALAATINEQIVSAVGKELETITTQARAAHTAIRTLFVQTVLGTSGSLSFFLSCRRNRAYHGWRSVGPTAPFSPPINWAISASR